MAPVLSPVSGRGRAPASSAGRVRGVDAARGLAVLGMVAVHVGHAQTASGSPAWESLAFSGLASVLFVVVAGVSLALSWPAPGSRPVVSGASSPSASGVPTTAARPRRTTRPLLRAALVFLLGLLLGLLEAPVAVILCHYGVLFALAPPLLRLDARRALAAGAAWVVLGPVAVFAATTLGWALLGRTAVSVDGRLWTSPVPADLLRPDVLLSDLLLTGYYPLLSWGGFLLLGIGLGRALESARDRGTTSRTARRLLTAGTAVWALGAALWLAVPRSAAALGRISAATGVEPETLHSTLLTGEHALVWLIPDPLWLALAVPHGGGVGEALRAAGAATAVLGLCVLLADRPAAAARARSFVTTAPATTGPVGASAVSSAAAQPTRGGTTVPLEAVGRIPLTLYAGHLAVLAVLAEAGLQGPSPVCEGPGWCWDGTAAVLVAWAGCLAVALALRLCRSRGPLEAGLQAAVGAVVGKPGPGPR